MKKVASNIVVFITPLFYVLSHYFSLLINKTSVFSLICFTIFILSVDFDITLSKLNSFYVIFFCVYSKLTKNVAELTKNPIVHFVRSRLCYTLGNGGMRALFRPNHVDAEQYMFSEGRTFVSFGFVFFVCSFFFQLKARTCVTGLQSVIFIGNCKNDQE